jgi:DNA-binding transcriptional ArsR family regulator
MAQVLNNRKRLSLLESQTREKGRKKTLDTRTGNTDELCEEVCYKEDLIERIRSTIPSREEVSELWERFQTLSSETRIRILWTLAQEKELCVCDIANIVRLSLSATSHQLRILRDRKLVRFRNDGNMVWYSLIDSGLTHLLRSQIEELRQRG